MNQLVFLFFFLTERFQLKVEKLNRRRQAIVPHREPIKNIKAANCNG
jgi:hypothetical protein